MQGRGGEELRHNHRMFFNLPTLLTWARIVAIPLIVGVFYLQLEAALQNLFATTLFVIVALTDWADGYLARRWPTSSSSAPRCSCWCT
jgi:cardiolipin synthase (CMP-forming)